jgi:hypothetical protein
VESHAEAEALIDVKSCFVYSPAHLYLPPQSEGTTLSVESHAEAEALIDVKSCFVYSPCSLFVLFCLFYLFIGLSRAFKTEMLRDNLVLLFSLLSKSF